MATQSQISQVDPIESLAQVEELSAADHGARLTGGKLLARNTVWNFASNFIPLLAAVIAVPRLTSALGTESFGLLMLAWATAGYFTFFDLGLGRAITKLVAERLGQGRDSEICAMFWT